MHVRAVATKDVLIDGSDAIVMVGDRLTLVSGIAVELLRYLDKWRSFDEVVNAIVEVFGPPAGSAEALIDAALIDLHDAGLIVVEELPERPLRLDMYVPHESPRPSTSSGNDITPFPELVEGVHRPARLTPTHPLL